MTLAHSIVSATIKRILRTICRIDDSQLHRVPDKGPLIIAVNHISSIEVPIIYTHLLPRPVTGFAKAETWDSPLLGPLANLWGAIPLHRGEADAAAFRRGLAALAEDQIVIVAPEGTRSKHGRLQRGLPGIILLALHSGAPILPIAYYGGEKLNANLRDLRRTDFHIAVGTPFRLAANGHRVGHELRQAFADETMLRIAALLPPPYRGIYAGRLDHDFRFTRPAHLAPPAPSASHQSEN